MSKRIYDVVAVVGRRKDDKPNYVNCGVVIEGEKGLSLKLNSIPAGNEWNGWFSLFVPKPRDGETYRKPADAPSEAVPPSPDEPFGDHIPF